VKRSIYRSSRRTPKPGDPISPWEIAGIIAVISLIIFIIRYLASQ